MDYNWVICMISLVLNIKAKLWTMVLPELIDYCSPIFNCLFYICC